MAKKVIRNLGGLEAQEIHNPQKKRIEELKKQAKKIYRPANV